MTQQPLREPLTELERQLADQRSDYAAYDELRQHTRRILDAQDDDTSPIEELRERLDASLVQAESEHPRLTAAIMRVLDTLNSLGI